MDHFVLKWIFLCVLLNSVNAEEAVVQINTKKPIHLISEKFLSFSVDPELLIDGNSISAQAQIMAHSLSPAYLRISGKSTNRCRFKHEEDNIAVKKDNSRYILRVTPSMWQAIHEWLKLANMTPVIALDYYPENWQPKEVIELMGLTKDLGIHQCVWQLGNEINATCAQKYTEDVTTLKTIANAFSDGEDGWCVAGSDIVPGRSTDKIRMVLYKWQNVLDAVTWNPKLIMNPVDPLEDLYTDKDILLRSLTKTQNQIWLSQNSRYVSSAETNSCNNKCLIDGLLWAQSLGDAAKQGFSVIFKELQKNDYMNPNFIYFISLLHKKLVGTKVLDTKITNTDRTTSHFYAHCSSNITDDILGGMTVFGVNMADDKLKTTLKMVAKIRGGEIWQYILTVKDNAILLNGENVSIDKTLEPAVKYIRPSKPISLSMPANSVGFWVIPYMHTRACLEEVFEEDSVSDESIRVSHKSKTSSAALLQQLILESLNRHNEIKGRQKRQLDPLKVLGRKINRKIQDNAKTKITRKSKLASNNNLATVIGPDDDVYKLTSAERQIFQERENVNLPRGDVHMEVGSTSIETEYDYIQSNETPRKASKKNGKGKKNEDYETEWVNENEEYEIDNFPNEFYENLPIVDYFAKNNQQPKEFGELGEPLNFDNNLRPQLDGIPIPKLPKNFKRNVFKNENGKHENIDPLNNVDIFVMKELEPTRKQNLEQMGKAKQKLRNYFDNDKADEESIEFQLSEPALSSIQTDDVNDFAENSEYNDDEFTSDSSEEEDLGRFKRSLDEKKDINLKSVSRVRRSVSETNTDGTTKSFTGEGRGEANDATNVEEVGRTHIINYIEKAEGKEIKDVDVINNYNVAKEIIKGTTEPKGMITLVDIEKDIKEFPSSTSKDKANYKIRLEKQKKKHEVQKQCKVLANAIEQRCVKEFENEDELFKKVVKRNVDEKYIPVVDVVKISKNKRKPLRFEHKLKKQIGSENKIKYNKKKDKYLNNGDWEYFPLYNRYRRNAILKDFSWEDEEHNVIHKNENQGPFSKEFIQKIAADDDHKVTGNTMNKAPDTIFQIFPYLDNENKHMKKIHTENAINRIKSEEIDSKLTADDETNAVNKDLNASFQNTDSKETNSNDLYQLNESDAGITKVEETEKSGVVHKITNKLDKFLNLIRDHIYGWWRLFTQH